jgi:hypothetical protein
MGTKSNFIFAISVLSIALISNAHASAIMPDRYWSVEIAGCPFGFEEYPWGTVIYFGFGAVMAHASIELIIGISLLTVVLAFACCFFLTRRRHANVG